MEDPKYTLLNLGRISGASGDQSKLIKSISNDKGVFINGADHSPQLGHAIWVGDEGTENWYQTSEIIKIIEENTLEHSLQVVFETKNSVYSWSMFKGNRGKSDFVTV